MSVSNALDVGDALPQFELPMTGNRLFRADDHRTGVLILYFYPKDATPGCTTESQHFRDAYPLLREAGAAVYGVSRDSIPSHERFRQTYLLPFDLISDPHEVACGLFQVIRPKTMYGKLVRGIERSTFLFESGVLRQAWRGIKVPGHVDAVLAAVQSRIPKNSRENA